MSQSGNSFQMNRSGVNSTESMSSTAGERLRDREKQRQARAQLAVEPESFTPLFSAPIKVPPPAHDATRKLIEEALGNFDQLKHSIVDDQKGLIGVWQQPQTPLPSKQHHDPDDDEEVGPRGFSSSMGGAKPEFAAPKKPSYRNAPPPPRFPSSSSASSSSSSSSQRPNPPRGGGAERARTVPPLAPPSSVPYHSSGGGYPSSSGREKDSNSAGGGGASGSSGPLGSGNLSNHASYNERNHNMAMNKRNSSSNGTGPPRPPNVTKNRGGGAYPSSSMANGGEDVELILKEMQVGKLIPEIAATPRNEFDPSRCEFSKLLNNAHQAMAPPPNPVADNGPLRSTAGGPGIASFSSSLKRLDSLVQNDLNISDSEDNNSDAEAPPSGPSGAAGASRSTDLPDPRSALMRSPIASPISPLAPETPCPPPRKSVSPLYPPTKRLSTSSDEGENSDDGSSSNSPSASGTDSSSDEEPEEEDEKGREEREDKTVTRDVDKTSQPPPESPPASVSSWRLTDFLQPPNPPQVDLNTSLSFDEPPTRTNHNNAVPSDDDEEDEIVPELSKELHDALGNIIVPPMLSPIGFSDSDDSATNDKDEEPRTKQVKPVKTSQRKEEDELEKDDVQRPTRPSSVASTHSTSSQHRRHLASPAFPGQGGKKVPDPAPAPPPVTEPSPVREATVVTPKKKRGRPPKTAAAKGPVTSTPSVVALSSPASQRQPNSREFLSSPSSSSSSSPSSSSSSSSSSSESSSEDEGGGVSGGRRKEKDKDTTTSDVDVTGTPSPAKPRLASPLPVQPAAPPPPPPRAPSSLASKSPVISEMSSSSSSSSEDEAPPPVMSKGKKSPPKLDHGGKAVQDKMKSKAIMRLIGPRGRSSNSISSTSSSSDNKKPPSTDSPLRATSNERPLMEVNEIKTPPPPVDGAGSNQDAKPSLMCRLRLNLLLRRPGEKKALAEAENGPVGGANAPTPPPGEKASSKKRQRRPSSSSVSSSASGRRAKHHNGGEKENREQKGVELVATPVNNSNNGSNNSKSSSKKHVVDGKTPEQRKEKRKRRNSEAETEPTVAPPPAAKKALVMDEPVREKGKEKAGKSKDAKRIRTKGKGGGASGRSSPLSLFTNHERNGDGAEDKMAELMNGHGSNKVKTEIKAEKTEGAGPESSTVPSERKENAVGGAALGVVASTSTSTPVPVYYSYFETPRPLPGSDDIDLDARDQNQYLVEAKKLKHAADRQSNRTLQVKQYLEAVLYFILTGIAMEHDPAMEKSAHILYKDTLGLIKTISSSQKALQQVDSKLVVLSLRCQSLLYLKLYRMRHLESKELQRIINDYQKKINDDAKREQPGTHPYNNVPAAVPVPTSVAPSTTTSTGLFRSTGTPSPLSPTPSPAGSVGSVGSQSSGYSSGEIPPGGGSSAAVSASSNAGASNSSAGGASAALTNAANPGGGGAKPDGVQVNNGALNGFVPVPVAVHNILLKQNQYSVYLNSSHDLWEQGDVLVHQAELQDFFIELDRICGPLTLHSSLRDLVRYARQGLQRLRYAAAGNSSR